MTRRVRRDELGDPLILRQDADVVGVRLHPTATRERDPAPPSTRDALGLGQHRELVIAATDLGDLRRRVTLDRLDERQVEPGPASAKIALSSACFVAISARSLSGRLVRPRVYPSMSMHLSLAGRRAPRNDPRLRRPWRLKARCDTSSEQALEVGSKRHRQRSLRATRSVKPRRVRDRVGRCGQVGDRGPGDLEPAVDEHVVWAFDADADVDAVGAVRLELGGELRGLSAEAPDRDERPLDEVVVVGLKGSRAMRPS